MAIRLALMSQHYASDRMWEQGLLNDANSLLQSLTIALSREEVPPTKPVIDEIISALANNFDTPRALTALKQWATDANKGGYGGEAGELARAIDLLLGISI